MSREFTFISNESRRDSRSNLLSRHSFRAELFERTRWKGVQPFLSAKEGLTDLFKSSPAALRSFSSQAKWRAD